MAAPKKQKTQAEADAEHDALMADVAKTQAKAKSEQDKSKADLEANDPGSTAPGAWDSKPPDRGAARRKALYGGR